MLYSIKCRCKCYMQMYPNLWGRMVLVLVLLAFTILKYFHQFPYKAVNNFKQPIVAIFDFIFNDLDSHEKSNEQVSFIQKNNTILLCGFTLLYAVAVVSLSNLSPLSIFSLFQSSDNNPVCFSINSLIT